MNIREKINQQRGLTLGVASAIILIAMIFIIRQAIRSRAGFSPGAIQAFYSDDDGQTWFVADGMRIVPFDHHGKTAVRAEVFRCKGSKPFVGYLERYSDAALAQIAAASPQNSAAAAVINRAPMEVKKPGDANWFNVQADSPASMKEYMRITTPPWRKAGRKI